MMVIGFCFSCDDIVFFTWFAQFIYYAMPWTHCFGYALFWMLSIFSMWCFRYWSWGDPHSFLIHIRRSWCIPYFAWFPRLRAPYAFHDNNALDISHDALHNLSLHYSIHNNKPLMMDDMFLYHATHLFEHWLFCANQHTHVRVLVSTK